MDRRQFGKLALSAGAATTGAGEAGLAQAQTPSVSPSDALKLPAELRPAFEQDYRASPTGNTRAATTCWRA